MVKYNYRLADNRLQYKRILNKKEVWLNIPYEVEVEPLLNYVHYNNLHLKKDRMAARIFNLGYFWFGFTEDIDKCIKNCGKYHCECKVEKIHKKPKIIISKRPHIRYQANIWNLSDSLKINNNYILDVIDHFSKWSISYLLKNKESDLILSKIKSFINVNGPYDFFQANNGLEFNNMNLKIYLENLNIKYIRSAPYHPQSNGCCETLHKQVKRYLLDDFDKKKSKFDIYISIVNFSEFHNDLEHTTTKYKPNFLRNLEDEFIINEVIQNILQSMKKNFENYHPCPKNTMLLLNPDIVLKGKIYFVNKKRKNILSFLVY